MQVLAKIGKQVFVLDRVHLEATCVTIIKCVLSQTAFIAQFLLLRPLTRSSSPRKDVAEVTFGASS